MASRSPLLTALAVLCLTAATGCQSSVHVKTSSEGDAVETTEPGGASGAKGPQGKGIGEVIRAGQPTVTYPGFEVLPDGRSVVNIQVSGPTEVTEQKSDVRLVYFLKGVAVPYKVNRLPLVSTNFATQVARVQMEQVDGGTNVIIELREAATPTHTVAKIEGGTRLTITLPKSQKFGENGEQLSTGNKGKTASGKPIDDDDGADTGDGRHRRRHKKSDDDSNDDKLSDADRDKNAEEKESKRRTKRAVRQPVPYVERHITLSYHTLAPDISVSAFGQAKQNPSVFLMSGIHIGIVDQFEVEATPHAFRLAPHGGYFYPSFGATWNFLQTRAFDMAVRARFFIPVDTASNTNGKPHATLVGGVPMIIHLGTIAKIDTGATVSMRFDKSTVVGLVDTTASPFYLEPGIPVKFVFQPADAAFLGFTTGLSVYDFNKAAATTAIPLGFQAGVTTTSNKKPAADFGAKFDFPQFFTPGVKGTDKIAENVYEFGFWLRWYYYL